MKEARSSLPERDLARTVIDVFVLEFRSELGSEVVHFDDDPANAGHQKIITEHGWNGDAERGDGRYQCPGNTGRHGYQTRRAGFGHACERIHYAPDGAEQAEKW